MLKRTLALVLAVVLVGTAGCTELKQLREKNAMLESELEQMTLERDELVNTVQTLTAARDDASLKLATAEKETNRMAGLLGALERERDALDRQANELKALLGDIEWLDIDQRPEGNVIVMENAILFAPGQVELTEESTKSLGLVADYLLTHEEIPVRIDGHTDGQPIKRSGWQDNYHLGAMRAHAVMKYLIGRGVPPERMTIVSHGPNEPRLVPDDPLAPMEENRRVEILLVPEGQLRTVRDLLNRLGD
jgi:chemotaxis protein MotB